MSQSSVWSIVIPTFRRPEALRESVAALFAQDYPRDRFELIVVDDEGGSTARAVIASLGIAPVPVRVETQLRKGAAAARNLGARFAVGEFLLFVDDDIVVASDHLERHSRGPAASGAALVNGRWEFSPAVLTTLEQTPFGRFRVALEQRYQEEVMGGTIVDGIAAMPMLGSWDLAVQRQAFQDLGGFDEAFPVAGAEDQDLSLRARRAGYELWLDTKIICLHNDNRLDLRSYCAREERSAQTMPVIARKFPAEYGSTPYIIENRPIQRSDSGRLVAKKLLKELLGSAAGIELMHRLVGFAERRGASERVLRRLYTALLGLHLHRGFKKTWGQ